MQRSAPLPPGSGRPSLTAPPLGGYDHADAVVVSTGNALIAWDDNGSAGIGRKRKPNSLWIAEFDDLTAPGFTTMPRWRAWSELAPGGWAACDYGIAVREKSPVAPDRKTRRWVEPPNWK